MSSRLVAITSLLALAFLQGCERSGTIPPPGGRKRGKSSDIAVIATLVNLGPTAQTTKSGLRYEDKVVGTGPSPRQGQTCVMHYTGWLTDGTVFDSSKKPGRGPFEFPIGYGRVIAGWDEGILSMKAGGVRRLVIPPELAYRDEGQGDIPPGATLVFDVELLAVK